jgi:SAM-dependent methyltransferase
VGSYLDEISRLAGSVLQEAAVDPLKSLPRVVDEIIRWKTVIQCRDTHAGPAGYFPAAEAGMAWQWENVIWPIIEGNDFSIVLELAPGHGRNTEMLRCHTGEIHLVDVNQSCLDACRARFGDQKDLCRFFYHLTDGTNLPGIGDSSISFGYSWDSMVHFDKIVVRGYVLEIARVLRPGGRAFLHTSNYGSVKPDSDWASNPGSRSDMSAALLRRYAEEAGLTVTFQRLSGVKDGWGMDDLDCLSVVERAVA